MNKQIKYTNEPSDVDLDSARVIKDFLPPPDQRRAWWVQSGSRGSSLGCRAVLITTGAGMKR